MVFAVNYRLSEPEAFPAEIDDVQTAVKWARENAYEYRMDPGRVGALGYLRRRAPGRHAGHPGRRAARPRRAHPGGGVVVGARWTSPPWPAASRPALSALLLPCPPADCPQRWADASPITHVDPTDAPFFLANSDDELVPVDQARSMAARLDTAGVVHQLVVVPGDRHGHDLRRRASGRRRWPSSTSTSPGPPTCAGPTRRRPGCCSVVILVVVTGGRDRRPAGAAPPQRRCQRNRAGTLRLAARPKWSDGSSPGSPGEGTSNVDPRVEHHHQVVDQDVVEHRRLPGTVRGGSVPCTRA